MTEIEKDLEILKNSFANIAEAKRIFETIEKTENGFVKRFNHKFADVENEAWNYFFDVCTLDRIERLVKFCEERLRDE